MSSAFGRLVSGQHCGGRAPQARQPFSCVPQCNLAARASRVKPGAAQRKDVCGALRNHTHEGAAVTTTDDEYGRRSVLMALATSIGLTAAAAHADEAPSPSSSAEPSPAVAFPAPVLTPTPQPTDPSVFTYDFACDVPSNLRVKEYWTVIQSNRPKVWQGIAQQIQNNDFATLSINLNVTPAADLRQAALYLPWALLQSNDFNAAVDARKAYRDFDEHVKDLQRSADAAAAGNSQPQQVQQAFILMSASLDAFLASIPAKYITALAGLLSGNREQQ